MDVEEAADELYGLPPDEFVDARKRLAKELRDGGDREGAKTVTALRRPTLAAWALNRLAREQGDDVARLVEAADEIGRAHAGGDVRAALTRHRELVHRLVTAAADILEGSGRGADAQTMAVRATLDAAAADPTIGEALRQGRLAQPADPAEVGLPGALPEPAVGTKAAKARRDADAEAERRQAKKAAEEEVRERRRELDDAGGAVRAAERTLTAAQRQRDKAAAALEKAEKAAQEI